MTRRRLSALYSARPELRPARALLSPVWLGALFVLGVNDHLLKGAGVLPGLVTGKLSDLAGMLVAPALLAALLGVRSRRGLLHCHIAVGLVFALINLSPACADAWSWLMGLVGFPWAITVDPTDLLALPALALGWRALAPAMRPEASQAVSSVSLSRWPTRPESAAAALGALLCVATSDNDQADDWGTDDGVWYEDIQADVYLHNSHPDHEIIVRVRDLRDDVVIDCFTAEQDPGVLFSEALFGAGQTWSIPPGANVPARRDLERTRSCHAVLLSGDTIGPQVLFWHEGEVPLTWVPGQHDDESYLQGAVILTADELGRASIVGSERDLVYPQRPPSVTAYLPRPDSGRVAWSSSPVGRRQITGVEYGPDGCAAIEFDGGKFARFYLCTPLTELPFSVGDYVDVDNQSHLLVLRRDGEAGDPDPVPEVELVVSRGRFLPNVPGATLAARPRFDGKLGPDPTCGTVAQPQEFSAEFGGQIVNFGAGERVELVDGAHNLVLHGVHAERRVIVAPECAEGPDALGDDLEVVYVWTASWQP